MIFDKCSSTWKAPTPNFTNPCLIKPVYILSWIFQRAHRTENITVFIKPHYCYCFSPIYKCKDQAAPSHIAAATFERHLFSLLVFAKPRPRLSFREPQDSLAIESDLCWLAHR